VVLPLFFQGGEKGGLATREERTSARGNKGQGREKKRGNSKNDHYQERGEENQVILKTGLIPYLTGDSVRK